MKKKFLILFCFFLPSFSVIAEEFHKAAIYGNVEKLSALLKKGMNPNLKDKGGNTALHYASSSGYLGMVELLIKEGANIRITNNSGDTGLHWATLGGHFDIISLFVEKGLNICEKNNIGESPFTMARSIQSRSVKHIHIVDFFKSQLSKSKYDCTPYPDQISIHEKSSCL